MPPSHRSKKSLGTEAQSDNFPAEQSDVEAEILAFCENELEKTKAHLNKAYRDGREVGNIDLT